MSANRDASDDFATGRNLVLRGSLVLSTPAAVLWSRWKSSQLFRYTLRTIVRLSAPLMIAPPFVGSLLSFGGPLESSVGRATIQRAGFTVNVNGIPVESSFELSMAIMG